MKSNLIRRHEIFEGIIPADGTPEFEVFSNQVAEREKKFPQLKEITKNFFKKVNLSLEAQYYSHINLNMESTLRHFLLEFNSRAWKFGLRSMPLSFNIMESYFNYVKPYIYFQLLEEENYSLSFFDFIDFITSSNFEENSAHIFENITSEIIYNFTFNTDFEQIKFKGENDVEHIITGLSLIRRNDEVTVIMITGKEKQNEELDELNLNVYSYNDDKKELFDEVKKRAKETDFEYEYIDDEKKYIKVLAIARIDLTDNTIDARYIAEENTLFFSIITDEIDGFLDEKGKLKAKYEETFRNSFQKIQQYDAIFEAIKFSLYIPYYLNLNEESLSEQNIETELAVKYKSPFSRKKFNHIIGDKYYTKSLYRLDRSNSLKPDRILLRDDLFRIETSGYWKKLEFDGIGTDKKGNQVTGKTWVNKNLSWFEAKESDLIIERNKNFFNDPDSGFIYIIRNPIHGENVFKIGLTRNTVNERINQLSKTSTPDKFYLAQQWNVRNCVVAEQRIHLLLNNYRIDPRREFFKIDYNKAIETINKVIKEINES
ncbi:GIY-YIG nuclease family protein [uncultured Chryseobacterium sp.]|uniref:GIY-YIG nuclease family protein n=1 Tax=uncultured Chryseobacterium sp. TaxID=259322 RepID=UPI0025DFA746|nr:GIY-YIG nuclease family protein [uncultured Chryseobacterium sp.]